MTKRTTPIQYDSRIWICLLPALLMTPVVLTWQAWRQARLDNALIVALRHHDDASAITLLNQGANARLSIPLDDVPPPTFWQILRSRFSGKSSPQPDGASCLMWALGIDTYSSLHDLQFGEWTHPQENPALIRALLAHGADPNLPYYSWSEDDSHFRMKMTPLLLAVSWRHPSEVQLLLDHHADPNDTNHYGLTPLMAVGWNLVTNDPDFIARGKIVENMLLAHGANIRAKYQEKGNDKYQEDRTAFSFCVDKGQETMFQTLLDHETDAKIRQHEIDRALVEAVYSGDKHFVRFLLAHHADVNTEGTSGTVIHDAERYRYDIRGQDTELIAILRHAGAKD